MNRRKAKIIALTCGVAALLIAGRTYLDVQPLPLELEPKIAASSKPRVEYRDRLGRPLGSMRLDQQNIKYQLELDGIPEFLRHAVIAAEDKRFYRHYGIDFLAIGSALLTNFRNTAFLRGGSTISQQVARILNHRGRGLYNHYLSAIEAVSLECRFSKDEILRYFLNQVPLSRGSHGVQEAARRLFDRDLDQLSKKEMLALAVLIRAPGRLTPGFEEAGAGVKVSPQLENRILALNSELVRSGVESELQGRATAAQTLRFEVPVPELEAPHFLRFLDSERERLGINSEKHRLVTTLDSSVQEFTQKIINNQVHALAPFGVSYGSALVVDNEQNKVRAWVSYGGDEETPSSYFDGVLVPRQAGSTLKPFLYAAALKKGWTAATLIEDEPLVQAHGAGIHRVRNYSGSYYGQVTLREALANSLNVPAIEAVKFVEVDNFLGLLRFLGFSSLNRESGFYGEGLALGNGEVTLLELVRAYSVLANRGVLKPLSFTSEDQFLEQQTQQVIDPEIASLISDILSDSEARRHEFDAGELETFSRQTAIKTGTSTNYCDAWAVAYTSRYTVGVWFGNLDRTPMQEIAGSAAGTGVLRGILGFLDKKSNVEPLWLSPNLRRVDVCADSGLLEDRNCPKRSEWFIEPFVPKLGEGKTKLPEKALAYAPRIVFPSKGLMLARDPRIPDELEAISLHIAIGPTVARIEWYINDRLIANTGPGVIRQTWQLKEGAHTLHALVWYQGEKNPQKTESVSFVVN